MLLIQEKLDGIKTRYSDITAASSKALRTLEQARQLATKFQSTHEELTSWMGQVEEELMSGGGHSPTGEQIPQFQQRQKVRGFPGKLGSRPDQRRPSSSCLCFAMRSFPRSQQEEWSPHCLHPCKGGKQSSLLALERTPRQHLAT